MRRILGTCALLASVACLSAGAEAALITTTLGNGASGFSDGATLGAFEVGDAQTGQLAPFDTGYGTDGLFGGDFDVSWTFGYGPIATAILGASLTIGIHDHDSAAGGSQVLSYLLDGLALTASLDTLFEAGGGSADGVYNVYTIALAAAQFAALADGSATVSLALQGPGLTTELLFDEDGNLLPGGSLVETATNGASLLFSTLRIETEDETDPGPGPGPGPGPTPVPEPTSLALLLAGFAAWSWRRARVADTRR